MVLALGSTFGCSRVETARSGTRPFEMLVPSAIETLDPRDAVDAYSHRATRLLHAGLTRLDSESLEPKPEIARSWTWTDERTLRLELDTAREFRDAERRVRGSDVCATIAAFRESRQRHVVEVVERCDAEDAAVVLHLRTPHPSLVAGLELPILREDQAGSPPRPDGSLDGLGPFRVVHASRAEVELASTRTPSDPHVVIRPVQDETARAMRLLADRADVVQNGFALNLADEVAKDSRVHVHTHAAANLTYVVLNNESPRFSSAAQRRAFAAAIPRESMAHAFFGDRARVARSLLPPTHWAYRETSCASLANAAEPSATGASAAQGVAPVRLLVSTDRFRRTIARVMAQYLSERGIKAEIVSVELGTLLGRLGQGDFDAAILQLPEIADPDVLRVFLHGKSVPPAGSNRGRVRNAQLDALLDQAGAELDPTHRATLYAQAFTEVCNQANLIPLWHEKHVVLTSGRAIAYTPTADGRWTNLTALSH